MEVSNPNLSQVLYAEGLPDGTVGEDGKGGQDEI